MLELHTTKAVRDRKGEKRRVGCYSSVKDIVEAMEASLESIDIMRNLVAGIGFDAFIDNRSILDRCAINFQIIGNQLGMLDPQLLTNSAMATAYSERSAIAHKYGNRTFDKSSFWEDINSDLDLLEQGCRHVLDAVTSQDVVFVSPDRKPRRFIRRDLHIGFAPPCSDSNRLHRHRSRERNGESSTAPRPPNKGLLLSECYQFLLPPRMRFGFRERTIPPRDS